MLKVLNYNQEKQRFELIETNYETIDDAIDAADDWLYSNTNHILFDDKLSTTEEIVAELHEQMKEKEMKKIDEAVEKLTQMKYAACVFSKDKGDNQ